MSEFTQVFFDDFNGSSLNRDHWNTQYSGQYWNGMFSWSPDQIEVGDGTLTIATERDGGGWLSGGLSTIPEGQTYGSYEFRARFDEGQGTAAVILLWPSDNDWTSEVDIIETHRPDREGFAFTNLGSPNVTQYIEQDISGWNTYRLDWTPDALKLFINGAQRSEITSDIPDEQMSFSMQGQVMGAWESWFGGGPDGSTPARVETEIDWVRISAWTPGSGTEPAAATTAPSWDPAGEPAVAADPTSGFDWMAAAQRYVERDGDWEGSWRTQVAEGQIALADVAARIQSGEGQWDLWQ